MTRTEDISLHKTDSSKIRVQKRSDLEVRKNILNKRVPPLSISIHMNKFEESKYKGTGFYANNDRSKLLGECIQSSLKEGLADGNTRMAKPFPVRYIFLKARSKQR